MIGIMIIVIFIAAILSKRPVHGKQCTCYDCWKQAMDQYYMEQVMLIDAMDDWE